MSALRKGSIPISDRDQRVNVRHLLALQVPGQNGDMRSFDLVVSDLSPGGFSFASPDTYAVGDRLAVKLPEAGFVAADVIWARDGRTGCRFRRALTIAELAAARLKSEPEMPATLRPVSNDAIAGFDGETPEPVVRRYAKPLRGIIWIGGAIASWIIVGALVAATVG